MVKRTLAKPERYAGLDLMRFIAALMVVAYHYTYQGMQSVDGNTWLSVPEVTWLTKYGQYGVQLFFIISGFVIAWSMHGRTPWQFFRARALRLVPAFVVAVGVASAVTALWGAPWFQVTWPQVLANLTFFAQPMGVAHVDGVYWTLQTEWQFYLAVTACLAVGLLPKRDLTFIALWLAATALALNVEVRGLSTIVIAKHAPWFCIGMLLYRFRTQGIAKPALALFAAAVWLACLSADLHNIWQHANLPSPPERMGVLLLVPAWVMASVAAVYIRTWPAPQFLVMLGGLTYPLYLLHARMGYIFFNHLQGWPRGVLIAMALAGVLAASWLMYKYVEPAGRSLLSRMLPK